MAGKFDLFGDPVAEGHGARGRPPHLPTQENRNRVSMLLAFGWDNERIAAALRITLPTLRKHYFSDLRYRDVARDRLDMRRAELLWREAEGGNVGAMKEFGRLLDRTDLLRAESDMAARTQPGGDARAMKPGKKVTDRERAIEADAAMTAELEREAQGNALTQH